MKEVSDIMDSEYEQVILEVLIQISKQLERIANVLEKNGMKDGDKNERE